VIGSHPVLGIESFAIAGNYTIQMFQGAAECMEEARGALLKGELETAERLSLKALSDMNGGLPALYLLGETALRRELFSEALEWFERAIEAGADDAVIYSYLGETYRRLGRGGEALRCLESSLQRNNADIAPHFNLAMLHRSSGEPRLAEHFFRNVLLLDPKMARAHFELAELYREEGHSKEAAAEYQVALYRLGAFPERYDGTTSTLVSHWNSRLGSLVRGVGETYRAIELLREAILVDCNNADAHLELARCMFEMSWEQDALAHCDSFGQLRQVADASPREYVTTRVQRTKEWCARRGASYVCLARAQTLSLPEFHTLPPGAKNGFILGKPFLPELYLATMTSSQVLPNQLAILSDDSRLLLDGIVNTPQSYLQHGEGVLHATDDLRVMLELPVRQIELGSPIAVLGGGEGHYSWMFESLARIWALEHYQDYKNLKLVIPENLTESRREMLYALGVDPNKVMSLPSDCRILASHLVVPSLMVIGHWISPIGLQYLRRKLTSPSGGGARRVFLSRSAAAHSRLKNQDEVLPLLLRHGFEIVDCIENSPMELISILSDATVVIGCDDDSIANMVVAPQGAKVGVIVSAGAYKSRSYFVCAQLGHTLTYLVAIPDFSSNPLHALCDFSIDPSLLVRFLESLSVGD
jgi:capsular polysaccharide biosynthesis protein/TPR repeat protein